MNDSIPDWQQNESQAKEAGQVVLDTRKAIREDLARGIAKLLINCGCNPKIVEDEKSRLEIVGMLERIGAP